MQNSTNKASIVPKEEYCGYRKIVISIIAGILLVTLYCVIFVFSAQDGEVSGSLSALISEKCAELINSIARKNWSEDVIKSLALYFEHPIRKLAHFSEYAMMGILVYVLWRPWKPRGKRLYFLVILWVFLSAASDEFHQTFVPGRDGNLLDVLLDSCGGTFGMGLCVFAEKIVYKFIFSHK